VKKEALLKIKQEAERATQAIKEILIFHESDRKKLRGIKEMLENLNVGNDEVRDYLAKALKKCTVNEAINSIRGTMGILAVSDAALQERKRVLKLVSSQFSELYSMSGGIKLTNESVNKSSFPWRAVLCLKNAIEFQENRGGDLTEDEDIVKTIVSDEIVPLQRDVSAMVTTLERVLANYKKMIASKQMIQHAAQRLLQCRELFDDFLTVLEQDSKQQKSVLQNSARDYLVNRQKDDSGFSEYNTEHSEEAFPYVPNDSLGRMIIECNYKDENGKGMCLISEGIKYLIEDRANINTYITSLEAGSNMLKLLPEEQPRRAEMLFYRLVTDAERLDKFIKEQTKIAEKSQKKAQVLVDFPSNASSYKKMRELVDTYFDCEVPDMMINILSDTREYDLTKLGNCQLLLDKVAQIGELAKFFSEELQTKYNLQPFMKCRVPIYHKQDNTGKLLTYNSIIMEKMLLEGVKRDLETLLKRLVDGQGTATDVDRLTGIQTLSERLAGIPTSFARMKQFQALIQSVKDMIQSVQEKTQMEAGDIVEQLCNHLEQCPTFRVYILMKVKDLGQLVRCLHEGKYASSTLSKTAHEKFRSLFEKDSVLTDIRKHRGFYAHPLEHKEKMEDNLALARLLKRVRDYDLAKVKEYALNPTKQCQFVPQVMWCTTFQYNREIKNQAECVMSYEPSCQA